jgi:hypothetical protein
MYDARFHFARIVREHKAKKMAAYTGDNSSESIASRILDKMPEYVADSMSETSLIMYALEDVRRYRPQRSEWQISRRECQNTLPITITECIAYNELRQVRSQ